MPERTSILAWRTTSMVDRDRKSTRLNSSHLVISYAVFCLKKKKMQEHDLVVGFCALAAVLRVYALGATQAASCARVAGVQRSGHLATCTARASAVRRTHVF